MRSMIKRVFKLRLLLTIIGLFVIIFFSQATNVSAEVLQKYPYLIKVNRVYNTITIYEQDEDGQYTKPIKAMLCSVGAKGQTKVGTFHTQEKYRWKLLMGDVWGQYSTRIVGGILFHSVYYYKEGDPATLATKEFNKLGTAASHGCVRLTVADAKWIYDNCAVGTTVVIYDGKKSAGPLGKPEAIQIASNVRWDPTDPNEKNPYMEKPYMEKQYIEKPPVITGVKNLTVAWDGKVDLLKGVKAKSFAGIDITSKLSVSGEVDTNLPGKYNVTYSVQDSLGNKTTETAFITVKKNMVAPTFTGISNKVYASKASIEKFALTGVEAFCADKKLDNRFITVVIKKVSDEQYYITYQASIGMGPVTTANSKVYIDNVAPLFTGITDRIIESGIIPDATFLMEGVSVSDNHSSVQNIKVKVTVSDNKNNTYLATYVAEDEVGNKAIKCAIINNNN